MTIPWPVTHGEFAVAALKLLWRDRKIVQQPAVTHGEFAVAALKPLDRHAVLIPGQRHPRRICRGRIEAAPAGVGGGLGAAVTHGEFAVAALKHRLLPERVLHGAGSPTANLPWPH